jgi:hypothetical protein
MYWWSDHWLPMRLPLRITSRFGVTLHAFSQEVYACLQFGCANSGEKVLDVSRLSSVNGFYCQNVVINVTQG